MSSVFPSSSSMVDARAPKRIPTDPAERALAVVLAVWGCFQPWALGTMHEWSQWIAFALATLSFLLALFPRTLELPGGGGAVRTTPWCVLFRLPLFWLGASVLLYITIQGANPAWAYRQSDRSWWMERQPHVSWLPSGYTAPFALMNEWRKLVILSSPLLAGCAAWLGITRRRTTIILLGILLANGTLVAALGIAQKLVHAAGIYGRFVFPNMENFASFVYRNHGAAYLLLIVLLALGLSARAYLRGEASFRRSTPSPVLGLAAALCGAAVFYSASRIGSALVLAASLLYGALLWQRLRRQTAARLWLPATFVTLLAAGAAWTAFQFPGSATGTRFQHLISGADQFSLRGRLYAFEVTRRMAADYSPFGVGAGGFRFLSPNYLNEFPEITREVFLGERNAFYVRRWSLNESHSDILQFIAEFGWIGGFLFAASGGAALAAFSSAARRAHPVGLGAWLALIAMMLYATCDFPFHNPATVATLVLIVTLGIRLADQESPVVAGDTSGPSAPPAR